MLRCSQAGLIFSNDTVCSQPRWLCAQAPKDDPSRTGDAWGRFYSRLFGYARDLGLTTAVGLTLPVGVANTWQPKGHRQEQNLTHNWTNVDVRWNAFPIWPRLSLC